MIQEIFVYAILLTTTLYAVWSMYTSLKPHKKNNTCSGCSGCSLGVIDKKCGSFKS